MLLAYALGTGGGQDENHVVAIIQGHASGYCIVGARIKPFISDNGNESGRLVVWLTEPAPENSSISFLTWRQHLQRLRHDRAFRAQGDRIR